MISQPEVKQGSMMKWCASVLLLTKFFKVGCTKLILKKALNALDLLKCPSVALGGRGAGRVQQTQLFVDVTQLSVQIFGFVVLLTAFCCVQMKKRVILCNVCPARSKVSVFALKFSLM